MMATSMFSIFDPSTSIFTLNWSSMIIILIIMPTPLWMISSRSSILLSNLYDNMNKEFLTLLNYSHSLIKTPFILLSTMLFIMINNFMGLFPYIFTASSHIMITMMMATPLWITALLFGWINHTTHMWAHMVPQGTPKPLMMFMVMIETTSVMIRPITLSVRLAANMIAGHLLISLLGDFTMNNTSILPIMLMTQNLLLILESAVAIIQAYVFVVLLGLYMTESHH